MHVYLNFPCWYAQRYKSTCEIRRLAESANRNMYLPFSGPPGATATETTNGLNALPLLVIVPARKQCIWLGIQLMQGLSTPPEGVMLLRSIKEQHPKFIVIYYTSPASALRNFRIYIEAGCVGISNLLL